MSEPITAWVAYCPHGMVRAAVTTDCPDAEESRHQWEDEGRKVLLREGPVTIQEPLPGAIEPAVLDRILVERDLASRIEDAQEALEKVTVALAEAKAALEGSGS